MTTVAPSSTATAATAAVPAALRRLYLLRFGFAAIWGALLFATASDLGPVSVTLLVLYPLFDVAAAVVDARSSGPTGPTVGLYANIAISSLAAVALALASASDIPAVLRVWGAWAIASGLVQLAVGASRRTLGGQWPMIASGAGSAIAGTSFILMAGADDPTLSILGGYAIVGGLLFLASALRLGRAAGTA
ncbi:hypothetical protein [Streptomyces hainanensis]|uniref:DUF308 domain-containing protein n=1 Tax=Streptomyces hainanensis TaxID=402648 RepID=A0A4R4T2G7_9ACTN|nr:hypothetical protein [Streptomyces hainanensis]TDC69414.1 hypothetical protein E1283_26040 [Streptomyces hainanensis]